MIKPDFGYPNIWIKATIKFTAVFEFSTKVVNCNDFDEPLNPPSILFYDQTTDILIRFTLGAKQIIVNSRG